MYSAASRPYGANPDGSSDVYCYSCRVFISKSFDKVNRALCELCRRVESGEPITEELLRAYKFAKAHREDVSMLIVEDAPPPSLTAKKFSFRVTMGDMLAAVGLKLPAPPESPSVRLAKEKRRPRLLGSIDLGSMDKVDSNLKADKK